jgi:hypothetical protein
MGVPKAVDDYLAALRTDIKHASREDSTALVVAARRCAETLRRYMAIEGKQSLAIDYVVAKCSNLSEAIRTQTMEDTNALKPLRRTALQAVDELAALLQKTDADNEATILYLQRK